MKGKQFAIAQDRSVPGTITVKRPPAVAFGSQKPPTVVSLFGQFEMGAAGKYARLPLPEGGETKCIREQWFATALQAFAVWVQRQPQQVPGTRLSIAFPHQIGCGLAGGDWVRYRAMIEAFANMVDPHQVTIVRLA